LAIAAVALAAFAGASVAAVTAPGQPNHAVPATEVDSVRPVHMSYDPVRLPERSRLQDGAEYLGISVEQLTSQLVEGKSMGEIAAGIPGKSEGGLIAAIVQQRRERMARRAETLPKRVAAAVHRLGGGGSGNGQGMLAVARTYLGLSALELARKLKSGKTLASIAESTPGRSRAGLSKALIDARDKKLERSAQAGKLSEAATQVRLAHVQQRVDRVLVRTHTHHAAARKKHAH